MAAAASHSPPAPAAAPLRRQASGIAKPVDGQVSIEMHLELYVSDLTALMASSATGNAREAVLNEVLTGLRFLFDTRVKHKLPNLDFDLCTRLCSTLLTLTGEMDDGDWVFGQRKLTKNAELAFEVIAAFTMYVDEFEDTIEDRSYAELRQRLRFADHVLASEDEEHRKIALHFLAHLSQLVKFREWKQLVAHDDLKAVSKQLRAHLKESKEQHDAEQSVFHKRRRAHPPKGQFYDIKPMQVAEMFRTDLDRGLSTEEVVKRRHTYGANTVPVAPPPSIFVMIWRQLTDFIVMILIASIVVSLAIADYKAAGALAVVVVVNAIIGFVQEYKAELALRNLASFAVAMAQVVRDGEQTSVPAHELVPGDIVVLDEGAQVPADLRLLDVAQLAVIESVLTGESEPVNKSSAAIRASKTVPVGDRTNIAFMSTLVTRGRARGVVVNTGRTTEVGRINAALGGGEDGGHSSAPATQLQLKLATLGKWLVLVSIVACAIVVVVGVARGLDDIVSIGISLAVSVVPEGLVVVVTLSLAVATQNMARRKAIVRRPPVVETLGAVSTICSDKTGTLTLGRMMLSELITSSDVSTFEGTGSDPHVGTVTTVVKDTKKERAKEDGRSPEFELSMLVSAVCNNSSLRRDEETGEWEVVGDPTEVALLAGARKAELDVDEWQKRGFQRTHEISFTSERKRMTVATTVPEKSPLVDIVGGGGGGGEGANRTFVLVKGAIEVMLPLCSRYLAPDGTLADMKEWGTFQDECNSLAEQGMRLLGLAVRVLPEWPEGRSGGGGNEDDEHKAGDSSSSSDDDDDEQAISDRDEARRAAAVEKELVFVGVVGIIDPPRKEVADSVALCHAANIRVCMITGDHRVTASSIARQIGILQPGDGPAMSGAQLAAISAQDLSQYDPFPKVFARVNPDDKLKIVQALQARGDIVAMTGDGVNDAPAIKHADVGIAMGISGTEITRQAADVILTDDNFATIVAAVSEGRRVYDNVQKFLVFLLAMNFSQVVFMLLTIAIGLPVPFTAIMILWCNVWVACFPSLALGVEPAEANVMTRPPRDSQRNILSAHKAMVLSLHILSLSGITLVVFGTEVGELTEDGNRYASSLAFMTLFTLHLVHSFEARSVKRSLFETGVLGNPALVWGCAVSFVFILIAIYIPGLNDFIELEAVEGKDLWIIVVAVVAHIFFVEVLKYFLRNPPFDSHPPAAPVRHDDDDDDGPASNDGRREVEMSNTI